MSFESDLNIAGSHLLEDEEGLSGELGDDELEQISGGPLPLLAVVGIRLAVGGAMLAFGIGAANGAMNGETEEEDRCRGRK